MSEDTIFERVMRRWATDAAEAKRYLGQVVVQEPRRAGSDAFLNRLPLPLAVHGRQIRDAHAARRVQLQRAQAQAQAAEVQRRARDDCIQCRTLELQDAIRPLTGEPRIAFLAGLDPGDRDRIATKAERAAAVALRKSALMAGAVRRQLGCTPTELDRWHADGRLPNLYTRRVSMGKLVTCRFWSAGRVTDAVDDVPAWREQDRIQRTFIRSGLKPVKGRPP